MPRIRRKRGHEAACEAGEPWAPRGVTQGMTRKTWLAATAALLRLGSAGLAPPLAAARERPAATRAAAPYQLGKHSRPDPSSPPVAVPIGSTGR
jgi:hypothetical protein